MFALLRRLFLAWLVVWAPIVEPHTWLFTKGRAWMQASLDHPFRSRGDVDSGQGTHAQLGPNQTMVNHLVTSFCHLSHRNLPPFSRLLQVVRWASSHNNTFSLAVVAAADQDWFYHDDFYRFLDDYIDSAPADANEAVHKPRYHGSAGASKYLNVATNTACAGGNCVPDLFSREIPSSDERCKTALSIFVWSTNELCVSLHL